MAAECSARTGSDDTIQLSFLALSLVSGAEVTINCRFSSPC